jgi:colicin import membrane protein
MSRRGTYLGGSTVIGPGSDWFSYKSKKKKPKKPAKPSQAQSQDAAPRPISAQKARRRALLAAERRAEAERKAEADRKAAAKRKAETARRAALLAERNTPEAVERRTRERPERNLKAERIEVIHRRRPKVD